MCCKDFLKRFLPGPGSNSVLFCNCVFVFLCICVFVFPKISTKRSPLGPGNALFPSVFASWQFGGKNAFSPMPGGLSCFVGRDRIDWTRFNSIIFSCIRWRERGGKSDFRAFPQLLLREAHFWNAVRVYGHCPYSFWLPSSPFPPSVKRALFRILIFPCWWMPWNQS